MKISTLCVLAGIAFAPAMAMGQWSDNFDSYPVGSLNGLTTGGPNALGTWQGWDNLASAAGNVSTAQFLSAPNSQRVDSTSDSVHRYQGVTSGAWSYQISQYIPQGFTGTTYFILNSVYNDGGPYQWAVQLDFPSATGIIADSIRTGEAPITFVTGQWATIRIDFDLTANTISQYYNGNLILASTYATAGYPALTFQGVDLYGGTGTEVFYDNASLVPAPAALSLLGMAGLFAGRRRRS